MRGIIKRAVALPAAAALGAAALVGVGASAAHAAVASGTVTLTVSGTFIQQMASHGVILVPKNAASVTYDKTTNNVTIVFTATGGDADVSNLAGVMNLSGSILGFSCSGKSVNLTGLLFDLTDNQFDGTTTDFSGETPLVDLTGSVEGSINGTAETFSASSLAIDSAGAALLDSKLGTSFFTAGQSVGSFAAAWTTS